MASAALALCEGAYSDAAPRMARSLASHLFRAGRHAEALALIERSAPRLEEERFLEELARLRGVELGCLVHRGAPAADVDVAEEAMRAALAEMGAPRITAQTLLDTCFLLPRAATRPDPATLLEEAHELFADMAMPGFEARCLEASGDVALARGAAAEARARSLSARDILERTGLHLRLPLLERKLAVPS